MCEADASGGDRHGGAERQLPNKQKGEQAAPSIRTEHFTKIAIGASGAGHSGAELSPDEAVADGEEGAEDPAEHRLRAAHGGDDEWNGDEGTDADHVDHVQRGRAPEPDLALKVRPSGVGLR